MSRQSSSQSRRRQIFSLLKDVENLQQQISRLPERKNRHYVDPYIKIGQASNLNLAPQTVDLAKEARKKSAIQRQAQMIL